MGELRRLQRIWRSQPTPCEDGGREVAGWGGGEMSERQKLYLLIIGLSLVYAIVYRVTH